MPCISIEENTCRLISKSTAPDNFRTIGAADLFNNSTTRGILQPMLRMAQYGIESEHKMGQ